LRKRGTRGAGGSADPRTRAARKLPRRPSKAQAPRAAGMPWTCTAAALPPARALAAAAPARQEAAAAAAAATLPLPAKEPVKGGALHHRRGSQRHSVAHRKRAEHRDLGQRSWWSGAQAAEVCRRCRKVVGVAGVGVGVEGHPLKQWAIARGIPPMRARDRTRDPAAAAPAAPRCLAAAHQKVHQGVAGGRTPPSVHRKRTNSICTSTSRSRQGNGQCGRG